MISKSSLQLENIPKRRTKDQRFPGCENGEEALLLQAMRMIPNLDEQVAMYKKCACSINEILFWMSEEDKLFQGRICSVVLVKHIKSTIFQLGSQLQNCQDVRYTGNTSIEYGQNITWHAHFMNRQGFLEDDIEYLESHLTLAKVARLPRKACNQGRQKISEYQIHGRMGATQGLGQ
ncbi:hypothetical protein CPB84DRAFT_1753084 [Gymnopilus junonius]|uniref:Uncharacterized protein n=1 Tax=Gymnopilus junonius TaxID=109634 RepID=A0A9P5NB15_GYMJU|nr:hypothetical protein CPB84DRAFT_1753084 [Gymnopilus junonius]